MLKVDKLKKSNVEVIDERVDTLSEKYDCMKRLHKMSKPLSDSQFASIEALHRSNQNEQYSRKSNFKIMEVPGKGKTPGI